MSDLPVIQKTYDLIKWYIPILNRLPRAFKFHLADRISTSLYDLLDSLLRIQYKSEKINDLMQLNQGLVILRYQARLLLDFQLIDVKRYENIIVKLNSVGTDLGGWIKQQKSQQSQPKLL